MKMRVEDMGARLNICLKVRPKLKICAYVREKITIIYPTRNSILSEAQIHCCWNFVEISKNQCNTYQFRFNYF